MRNRADRLFFLAADERLRSAKAITGKDLSKTEVAEAAKAADGADAADKKQKEAVLQALKELETSGSESGWKAQKELLSVVK